MFSLKLVHNFAHLGLLFRLDWHLLPATLTGRTTLHHWPLAAYWQLWLLVEPRDIASKDGGSHCSLLVMLHHPPSIFMLSSSINWLMVTVVTGVNGTCTRDSETTTQQTSTAAIQVVKGWCCPLSRWGAVGSLKKPPHFKCLTLGCWLCLDMIRKCSESWCGGWHRLCPSEGSRPWIGTQLGTMHIWLD